MKSLSTTLHFTDNWKREASENTLTDPILASEQSAIVLPCFYPRIIKLWFNSFKIRNVTDM
jgi:hypothetical protein